MMEYFSLLCVKIAPLYIYILMGYLAGKVLDVNRNSVAQLLFYLITPLIIFNGVIKTQLDAGILLLPIITFLLATGLCLLFYQLSKPIWQDSTRNLVAFSSGNGNTGYFGLPLALLLFNEQGEGIYILALLGVTLFENSIGYYIVAKGDHTPAECLWKALRLPSLYAFLAGLTINFSKLNIPDLLEFASHLKGAYTVLGMMVIGLGLSTMKSFKLDMKYIGMTFLAKFVAWPVVTLFIIYCDKHLFGLFDQSVYDALILLSIVPLAANTVILASIFKSYPEKAAAAVVISIIFAMVYTPFMTTYLISEDDIVKGNPECEHNFQPGKA